jgi:hypothetical protein
VVGGLTGSTTIYRRSDPPPVTSQASEMVYKYSDATRVSLQGLQDGSRSSIGSPETHTYTLGKP